MDPASIKDGIDSGSTTWAVIAIVGMFLMLAKDIVKVLWAKKEEHEAGKRVPNLPDETVRSQTEQTMLLRKNEATIDGLSTLHTKQINILQNIATDLRLTSENQKEMAHILQNLNSDHIRLFNAIEKVLDKVS